MTNPPSWTGTQAGSTNPLKMTLSERKELMIALTQMESTARNVAARQQARTPMPEGYSVAAIIQQTGGVAQQSVLAVRDVSNSGLAFLHHHYLSTGTRLHLVFVGPDRQPLIRVQATVVRCVHARGMAHDVGAKFEQVIDIMGMLGVEESGPSKVDNDIAPTPSTPPAQRACATQQAGLLEKLAMCSDPLVRTKAINAALAVLEAQPAGQAPPTTPAGPANTEAKAQASAGI